VAHRSVLCISTNQQTTDQDTIVGVEKQQQSIVIKTKPYLQTKFQSIITLGGSPLRYEAHQERFWEGDYYVYIAAELKICCDTKKTQVC